MWPGLEAAELPADAVEVGHILGAWGVAGWFKVQPYSANPEALLSSKRWLLLPARSGAKTFSGAARLSIQQAKIHAGSMVAAACGFDDREAAQALQGACIYIARSDFPMTRQNEYYWVDLIGLDVVNRENVALGTVRELLATGAQTVLVLDYQHEGKTLERMIPFVSVYVDEVDQAARRIVVNWQADYLA